MRAPTEVVLTWEGRLEVSENVGGPWCGLSTSNNRYVSPLNPAGGRRFFRLVNP